MGREALGHGVNAISVWLEIPLVLEGGMSGLPNSAGSDAGATLLRLITPDPDRLPIWIWMVATSSDEPFVVEMKPEEVGIGWAVVVFQKWPVLLCARPRLSEETMGMRVEKRIATT